MQCYYKEGKQNIVERRNRLLQTSLELRNYILNSVDSALRSNFNFRIIREVLETPYQERSLCVKALEIPYNILSWVCKRVVFPEIDWHVLVHKAVLFNTDLGPIQFTSLQQTILPSSEIEAELSSMSLL